MPARNTNRPFLLAVSSHWVSLMGLALALTALISWMFVLPVHIRGHVGNPYIGILVFIIIPMIFFAGLATVPGTMHEAVSGTTSTPTGDENLPERIGIGTGKEDDSA